MVACRRCTSQFIDTALLIIASFVVKHGIFGRLSLSDLSGQTYNAFRIFYKHCSWCNPSGFFLGVANIVEADI